MSSEKYINYYIDTLVSTLTDCVVRNISLQANAKVTDDVIGDHNKQIEQLQSIIENLKQQVETEKESKVNFQNSELNSKDVTIKSLRDEVAKLNNEINQLVALKNEYENVKHQVRHLDTFRNELQKEREEHQKTRLEVKALTEKIDYLQLTPAKRKKVNDLNKQSTEKPEIQIEDGGSF